MCFLFVCLSLSLCLSFTCNNFKTEKLCELLKGIDMTNNGANVGDFVAFVHCGAFDEPLDKGAKKSSKHILFYHKMAEKGIQINFCQLSLSFCSRAHFYHLDIEECPNHFW